MIDFGIIAAGDGNRIKEEGSLLPKPLVDIQGQPMIGRLVDIMENAGARSISVIVNSDMPEVMGYLDFIAESKRVSINIFDKKTESSMHTFYELMKLMNPQGRFIVTTVDTIFHQNAFKKYAETFSRLPETISGLMGVTNFIDDEKPLYVEVDKDMNITAYRDNTFDGVAYVSAGIYGLDPKALPILDKCIESGITRMRNFQRALIENGLRLKAYNLGKVIDVDHISDIEKANVLLSSY